MLLAFFLSFSPPLLAQTYKKRILFYGPTLSGNLASAEVQFINNHSDEFQPVDNAPGHSAVFTSQQWVDATVADFQQFDAVVISDLGTFSPEQGQAAAVASRAIWGSAITGNFLFVAGDPRADLGFPRILRQGIRFAAEQAANAHGRTGIYIAIDHLKIGEDLGPAQNTTDIPLLSWFGSFKALEVRGNDDQVRIVTEHPILNVVGRDVGGYTLQGGSDSTQGFHSWPYPFFPVAYRLFDPAPTPVANCAPLIEADTGYELHIGPGCSSGQAPLVYILARTALIGALHRLEPALPNLARAINQTANLVAYSTAAGFPDPNNPGPGVYIPVRWQVVNGPNTGLGGAMTQGHTPWGQPNGIWTANYNCTGTVTPSVFQDIVQFFYDYNNDGILNDLINFHGADPDDPAPGITIEYATTMTINWHQTSTPELSLSVPTPTTTEGPACMAADIRIARSGGSTANPLTIHFCRGGTATPNTTGTPDPDYFLTASPAGASVNVNSGVAVIPAGSSYMDILVNPIDDVLIEGTETVRLALADVTDGTYVVAGLGYTNASIIDNDQPTVSASGYVSQAAESGQSGAWIVNTQSPVSADFRVYFTLGGTASNGVDYLPALIPAANDNDPNDNIILPSGTCRTTLHLGSGLGTAWNIFNCSPLQDSRTEGTETAVINLLSNPGYVIGTGVGTINILDDDSTKIPANGYNIIDIGDANHTGTAAYALNNQCTVVGDFYNAQGFSRGYAWSQGLFTDLPVLPQLGAGKNEYLSARVINDNNWVLGAGRSQQVSPPLLADYYYLWINGGSVQLQNPAAADFNLGPAGANNSGHLVGSTPNGSASFRATRWDSLVNPPSPSDLNALSATAGAQSHAWAINAAASGARVAGSSRLDLDPFANATTTALHAFRTQAGNPNPLPVDGTTDDLGNGLGSDTSSSGAYAINSLGEVVGVSDYAPPGMYGALVFAGESRAAYKDAHSGRNMGWQSLNILGGGSGNGLSSQALGINDAGLIVGWSRTSLSGNGNPKAAIWENTPIPAAVNLNTKIPAADQAVWVLTNAQAINNSGVIAGSGTKVIGGVTQPRAFLLVPYTAPHAPLINIYFNTGLCSERKAGPAAFGYTPCDYWNSVSVEKDSGPAFLTPLLTSAGASVPGSSITVDTGGGEGDIISGGTCTSPPKDVVIRGYFASGGGENMLATLYAPAGTYDLYLYGILDAPPHRYNSSFTVTCGAGNYGTQATSSDPSWDINTFVAGHQYVSFANITVPNSVTPVLITVSSALEPLINGLQLVQH